MLRKFAAVMLATTLIAGPAFAAQPSGATVARLLPSRPVPPPAPPSRSSKRPCSRSRPSSIRASTPANTSRGPTAAKLTASWRCRTTSKAARPIAATRLPTARCPARRRTAPKLEPRPQARPQPSGQPNLPRKQVRCVNQANRRVPDVSSAHAEVGTGARPPARRRGTP